ncbi:putative MFS-type transporter [Cyphellophora attinorum]|uniref:Putative MFS-type transporter n=1 Tax=Cyphellophora attinorum TaxID=1664694 RepID=A0A0N1HME1_9EURO|nr:putative MFS-type transporter [Phialophora attinorum]KPI38427.1 putative MFS-type transporter [Phialophora attinorum]
MGLGIKDDKSLDHVPGTVLLDDETTVTNTGNLKHGKGRNAHIVLSPQPSNDPNDPLNWSAWKKELIIVILSLGAMLNAGVNGPLLNASYFGLSQQLDTTITTVVLASGYNLLAAGCIGPFVCAFARKYGKRPVFLVSTLFIIVGTAIGQAKVDYNYLLAARIIQGFSTSAFESLIVSTVGDIYFVHQRGLRIAVINFILNAASSLASIICGIFCVFQFLLMFFFCPETTYLRDTRYNTDLTGADAPEVMGVESKPDVEKPVEHAEQDMNVPTKKTFVQELAVYTGVYSQDSIFKFLLGPFLTLLNPAACYAVIASGLLNSWYVGSAIILAGIFAGPPWTFNAAQIGYLGAGPFIGGLIGSLVCGFFGDHVIKYLTRRNKGIYEPEFRLVFMLPSGIACGLGMFLFGYTLSIGASAYLCAFLQGVMMVGVLIGIFSSLTYGLDAFRSQSNEIFVMNMLFKNFMFYGLSNFANDWVAAKGPQEIMYVFGGTSIFLCLLALPVYIFGKRLRAWWSRNDLFVKLNMTTSGPAGEMG